MKEEKEYLPKRGPTKNIIKSGGTKGRNSKLVRCLYGCARYLILDREKGILVCPNCGRSPANSEELVPVDRNKLLTADGYTSTGLHTSPRAQKFKSKWKSRSLTPKGPQPDDELRRWAIAGGWTIKEFKEIVPTD